MLKLTGRFPLTTGGMVIVETDNANDFHGVQQYLNQLGVLVGGTNSVKGSAEPELNPGVMPEEKPAAERKPRAKKAAAEEPAAETKPAKAKETKLTISDVTAAVTALANAKGVAVARSLITKFGKQKASEIEPDDFAQFIAEAKEALNAEEAEQEEELPL